MRQLIALACLMLMAFPAIAKEAGITVDLASDHIDITAAFNGSYLTLYGVKEGDGEVAVVIKGPEADMIVRQKHKIFGVWTNADSMRFENMPIYYDYAVADNDLFLAGKEVLMTAGFGLDTTRKPPKTKREAEDVDLFQDALIRNKQVARHFAREPAKITYLDKNFFKATFYVPPNVPTGKYTLETLLFQNGVLQDTKTSRLTIEQIGVSAAINSFSKKHSFFYGLFCVIFAMSAGWLSNAIRRAS